MKVPGTPAVRLHCTGQWLCELVDWLTELPQGLFLEAVFVDAGTEPSRVQGPPRGTQNVIKVRSLGIGELFYSI